MKKGRKIFESERETEEREAIVNVTGEFHIMLNS